MKKIIIVLLVLIAPSVFAGVRTMNGFYVGGAVASMNEDYEGTGVEFIGGYKHNSFVGGELRLGRIEDDVNYVSALYRVESANSTGKTYLLAGYTYGDTTDNASDSFSGFTYGAGVGVVIFNTFNLNAEYRIFRDNSNDIDMNAFSIGLDYKF